MLKNKKIIFSISILLLSIGGLTITDSFGQTNGMPELLSDAPQNSQIKGTASSSLESNPIPSDNLIRESKQVYVNTSVFDQDTFTITTFDEIITITKDSLEVKDDYAVWWGTTNDGYNANFLIFNDDTIQASIQTAETKYNIGWTGIDKIHTLQDVNVSQLPPDHGADYFDSHITADQIDAMDFVNLPQTLQDEIELYANSHVGGRDYSENAVTITLVVGYSTAADNANTRLDRTIRSAVEDANRTYETNGLPIVLVVADRLEARGFVESLGTTRTPAIIADINNLLTPNDPNNRSTLDRLRSVGVNENADVVILITHYPTVPVGQPDPNGCGISGAPFYPENVNESVVIVRDICLRDNFSLPHEIGHLQGARHNPESDPSTTPFTYQHGHYSESARERTIMSYDCPSGCTRMGQWSDPNETYGNRGQVQAGSETVHFNAKILYGSAQYLASMRGTVERYDIVSPQGAFEWVGEQVSRIFTQGDTMNISATFDEPIHDNHPPTVTISDGTTTTPIVMSKTSETVFTTSHLLTTERGSVTLEFSNAQDLFTNPVIPTATGNSGSVTVNVPDIIAPVITLNNPEQNPQIIELGSGYTELGAITDDGSPVTIDDSEFVDAIGSYTIYYDSVDTAGNPAIQVIRTVNVVAPPPTLPLSLNFANDEFIITYDFPSTNNCVTKTGVFGEPWSTLDNTHFFPQIHKIADGTIMYDWFDLQYYGEENMPVETISCSGEFIIPLNLMQGESDFRIWTYYYQLSNPTQWDSWTDPMIHQVFIEYTETTFNPERSYGGCAAEMNLSVEGNTVTQRIKNSDGTCSIVPIH